MSLSGRNALVTGAGRGIGAAIATTLAAAGARIVLAARTSRHLDAVAAEIAAGGGQAVPLPCDVTSESAVQQLARDATDAVGAIDILVNNAGTAHSAPLAKISLDDWQRLFLVNATSTFLCMRAFVPAMMDREWGRVVNIASVAGIMGDQYIASYSAAKHAVLGLTRSVAAEAAQRGVTVNAVCPGYVDTPMTDESVRRIATATGRSERDARDAILARTAQRRLITPEEVAHVVLSLCHESAHGVNGASIIIDGGNLRV